MPRRSCSRIASALVRKIAIATLNMGKGVSCTITYLMLFPLCCRCSNNLLLYQFCIPFQVELGNIDGIYCAWFILIIGKVPWLKVMRHELYEDVEPVWYLLYLREVFDEDNRCLLVANSCGIYLERDIYEESVRVSYHGLFDLSH